MSNINDNLDDDEVDIKKNHGCIVYFLYSDLHREHEIIMPDILEGKNENNREPSTVLKSANHRHDRERKYRYKKNPEI